MGLRWDYKDPRRGPSFEFTNIWDSLRQMPGIEADLFAIDELEVELGRSGMNEALVDRVLREEPDLVFFLLFEDELDPATVEQISERRTTLNWFADDHWRFNSFSRYWAHRFTWVATTDPESVDRYRSLGCPNVVLTQWGCNHHLYRPLGLPQDLDLSFVGQPHGSRPTVIKRLLEAGFEVSTWGHGWPAGRITQGELVAVINRSKINLNLSNASVANLSTWVRRLGSEVIRSRLHPIRTLHALRSLRAGRREQLKGRNFEVPGCGAFLLTNDVPYLEEYFVPGQEIVTFTGIDDLFEKARYYLDNDDDRSRIAEAGLRRTLADHTYERRFSDLFRRMELL